MCARFDTIATSMPRHDCCWWSQTRCPCSKLASRLTFLENGRVTLSAAAANSGGRSGAQRLSWTLRSEVRLRTNCEAVHDDAKRGYPRAERRQRNDGAGGYRRRPARRIDVRNAPRIARAMSARGGRSAAGALVISPTGRRCTRRVTRRAPLAAPCDEVRFTREFYESSPKSDCRFGRDAYFRAPCHIAAAMTASESGDFT